MQKRFFGGCQLTRRIVDLVEESGFTTNEIETLTMKTPPRHWAPTASASR